MLENPANTPTPVELYRSVLSAAENKSINIISIGFLTNIADLLRSGSDSISDISGLDLVTSKVRELVVMGGEYPSGWEYNFSEDGESTQYVLEHWPKTVPITFSGVELGGEIYSGQTLMTDVPFDSPVRAAYEWYIGRCNTTQKSWDPLTMLYGVLGFDKYREWGFRKMFAFANNDGYNSFETATGLNAWVDNWAMTTQHWLKLADGVTNEDVSGLLDFFFALDPTMEHSFVQNGPISMES